MLYKLLQIYENKIINERPKKKLGWIGGGYIFLTIICLVLYLIFQLLHIFIGAIISSLLIFVVSIVFWFIAKRKFRIDEQDVKNCKKETIDKFAEILEHLDMDNKETIEVMIEQCKEYENTENKTILFVPFKSVFTIIIYPIITTVIAIIVKNMSDQYIIEWSIFIIGIILIIYMIVASIYPILVDFANKYKKIAKMMRNDLEYILAMKK